LKLTTYAQLDSALKEKNSEKQKVELLKVQINNAKVPIGSSTYGRPDHGS